MGITMGDAAGIGPEIICKLFAKGLPHPAIVYGDAGVLNRTVQQLKLGAALTVIEINAPDDIYEVNAQNAANQNTPAIIAVVKNRSAQPLPANLPVGMPNALAGKAAFDYLCQAIDHANQKQISAIVTAPINKHAMDLAGINQPGHTEILAERSNTDHVAMVLVNDELRVILVTIHEALAQVPSLITRKLQLQTIKLAYKTCRLAGIELPRIAVAGLNPHAGENGKFGNEEIEIISPAIAEAKATGIDVSGPYAGDTIFMRARQGEFDIVVAQYHDQGLIPIKYMGLDTGVNMTVGLPFVRTSVDHGTAYDIAGQGVADESSLRSAFNLAVSMLAGNTTN